MEHGAVEPQPDHYRASDDDRQQVADRLRQALDDGRLTIIEYDERLGAAYGSLTYGELAEVTKDLPAPAAPQASRPARQPKQPNPRVSQLFQQGRAWAGGAVVMTGIWGVTSFTDADPGVHPFWPAFPLGIWALGLIGSAIGGNHRGHDRRSDPRNGGSDQPDHG